MAKLLTLLFEVTEIFDMETRPELLLLQKTMVVVEGVARNLDAEFNMWRVAEPVIKQWITHHLGPVGIANDAKAGLHAVHRLARQMPEFAERAERLSQEIDRMQSEGMRFDAQTAEAIGKAEARHTRSGRLALWVIALSAIMIAYKLYF